MPISVQCASCRAPLDVPDAGAIRPFLCPHCGDKVHSTASAAVNADEPDDGIETSPAQSTSPLVAVALCVGAAGLACASVPSLNLAPKPLGLFSLVLGAAAWAGARKRRQSVGVLLPAALVVGVLVVLFAGSWGDWKEAFSRPSRAARERTVVVPTGTQGMEAFARAESTEWLDVAKGALENNGVRVRVTSVNLAPARYRVGGKEQRTPAKRLLVTVRMTGEHLVRLANYESWADPTREAARHEPRLVDDRERSYRRVSFGPGAELAGSSGDTFMTPGKPVVDVVAFEAPPLDGVDYLRLELPASAFGGAGALRFQIPKSAIRDGDPPGPQAPPTRFAPKGRGEKKSAVPKGDGSAGRGK